MAKDKKERDTKKYSEFFEVEKDGKTKVVKAEGIERSNKPTKKQINEENRILRNILITIGILIILALSIYFAIDSIRNFEYKGIEFETIKYCDVEPCLILYQTKFPVINNGELVEYNFYLRNDPRKLNIPFNGSLKLEDGLSDGLRINITDNLNCNGDAIIALGNIVNFYKLLDVDFARNESLGCDLQGKSIFLDIQEGDKTIIEQTGPSCYRINVNNCEVLEGTEKFLLESFVEVNRLINKN